MGETMLEISVGKKLARADGACCCCCCCVSPLHEA